LVDSLLILCEVNSINLPELPQWREKMAEQERRMEQFRLSLRSPQRRSR